MPPPPIEENGVATTSTSGSSSSVAGGKPVRHFTWKDLSQLNKPENAHVAVRGKVSKTSLILVCRTLYVLSIMDG